MSSLSSAPSATVSSTRLQALRARVNGRVFVPGDACGPIAGDPQQRIDDTFDLQATRSYSCSSPPRRSHRLTAIVCVPVQCSIAGRPFGGASIVH
jgi:hypothetical protein